MGQGGLWVMHRNSIQAEHDLLLPRIVYSVCNVPYLKAFDCTYTMLQRSITCVAYVPFILLPHVIYD